MPTRKSSTSAAASDVEEVQKLSDQETDQGFAGTKVDPLPNEAYTLETGPDSPSAFADDTTRAGQHSADKET